MLPKIIHSSWEPVFNDLESDLVRIRKELLNLKFYPTALQIFAAFQIPFPPAVAIIGQDPYPQQGLANGIAFAVPKKHHSPSLEIIFNEVAVSNHDVAYQGDETMMNWVNQGVLLLNSALTVKPGEPNNKAHVELWMPFMVKLVYAISSRTTIPWCLWGDRARKLKTAIVLGPMFESVHPIYDYYSMTTRFRGTNHFGKVNEYLSQNNSQLINW
jgi:uracil-DNA glycosylase